MASFDKKHWPFFSRPAALREGLHPAGAVPGAMPPTAASVFFRDDDAPPTADDFAGRLRRARLGVIVALVAVVMVFVSYSSAYVVRQGLPTLDPRSGTLVSDWLPVPLPNFLLINTIVLLVSTLTMELARRQSLYQATAAQKRPPASTARLENDSPWLPITAILGLAFLAGQWLVWRELAARGFFIATTPSSSFFYLLTATHGVHLLGGIVALLIATAAPLVGMQISRRAIVADATAWYWHFMTGLWIYLLFLLEFAH